MKRENVDQNDALVVKIQGGGRLCWLIAAT
jgi:hypothetical protein